MLARVQGIDLRQVNPLAGLDREFLAVIHRLFPFTNRPGLGSLGQLCLRTSDVDILRDLDCVVDLDAEVTASALDLGVTEQELRSTQVAGSSEDQCCRISAGRGGCWPSTR
jgi:hypothetical protein